MRRVLLLLCLLAVPLFAVGVTAQAPTPIGPTEAIGFDYLDADMVDAGVLGFEAQYDAGPWTSIGIPTGVVLPSTVAGAKTYKAISPFVTGTHTVLFRACNSAGCGSASVPFAFAHVSNPTVAPGNVRKVPR